MRILMTVCNITWSEMTKYTSGLLITVCSEVAMIFHMDTCLTHIHKLPCVSLTYDVPLCVCVLWLVVSNSATPWTVARLLCSWDFPGKNTGVGCQFLLQDDVPVSFYSGVHMPQFSSVAQSCPTLCDPMNCSTPGLPVHHQLPEFTQTYVHQIGDAIQPCHPLSSPSPPVPNPSQHQSLFQ